MSHVLMLGRFWQFLVGHISGRNLFPRSDAELADAAFCPFSAITPASITSSGYRQPRANSWNIGTLLERLGSARFLGLGQGTEGRLRIGFDSKQRLAEIASSTP